ncbi:MAG: prolipoprotein diacylglyceryl transferase [Deltaproteobacteria bacterium]|nr:prolipoprotein diacylglyceryl transferase [Deltaproteobacteria bacterium]MBW1872836.1 prolipoprotein diacylglyceryl transferase [Deltaproteobacteria bacterium]
MIPYISIPTWDLGFVVIDPFGILVAIAILVGFFSTKRRAARVGLDPEEAHTMFIWIVLGSFTMAHIVSMVFYFPERLIEKPWEIFFIWAPISSMGGFLGALITAYIYTKKRKISFLAYCDVFMWGIVIAWIFGRMGCSIAHDHPGALSDFFLAVKFPRGARHDLGFYEFLFTLLVMYPITRMLGRKPRPDGFFLTLVPIIYAPIRFMFDFLRSTDYGNIDLRYLGLTAAQWLCIAMLLASVWGLVRVIRKGRLGTWPEHGAQEASPPEQEPMPNDADDK